LGLSVSLLAFLRSMAFLGPVMSQPIAINHLLMAGLEHDQ